MDANTTFELAGQEKEITRLRHEKQRLLAEVERVRRERDEAETQFANSQTKVAQLEHQVRKQTWRIADLEAERHALPIIHGVSEKLPPLDPAVPPQPPPLPEFIEISDHEEDEIVHDVEVLEEHSGGTENAHSLGTTDERTPPPHIPQIPKKERQFMDFVSIPPARSPSKPHAAAERPTSASSLIQSPSPGRFKRSRSASPSIERSPSSTVVEDDLSVKQFRPLRSVPPTPVPPVKRQRTSTTGNVKKVKKEAFTVPQNFIDVHLNNTPKLEINPVSLVVLYVSRAFLREEYGGSDQQFIQRFRCTDDTNTGRALVFPQADLNPFLPSRPGEPGLIFTLRREIADGEPWALFCKDHPSATAVWRYMGNYRNSPLGQSTAKQFQSQTPACQRRRGEQIAKAQKWPAYVDMRARIALRKAGLADDPEAVAREVTKITGKGKKGTPLGLTPQDVIDAFSRGEEALDIIKMQCVSYDHEFVADMARRHEIWNTPEAVAQRTRKKKQRATTRKRTVRKRASTPVDDSDSDFAVESEDSESKASVGRT
ncbi:hypothetical protein B0H17DRAFT_599853 [Mycena rosella]|uniref:DUF6697 domain-containing protein n=1 Tax=Mycena rosella TaxID=1033263 RepID=A0AAD7DHW0_MYCRO|nr:hypothetical protein B0H17DRAFT_599853 [Mycena rosella]